MSNQLKMFQPQATNGLPRKISFFDPRSTSLAPKTGWSLPDTSRADLVASAVKGGTMSLTQPLWEESGPRRKMSSYLTCTSKLDPNGARSPKWNLSSAELSARSRTDSTRTSKERTWRLSSTLQRGKLRICQNRRLRLLPTSLLNLQTKSQ